MGYNPALDGLRAVAVFAVIAFHCRFPLAYGGMIGVDVFFVLSGYLITSILRREIGLLDFYWRRAIRLCPALFIMLAAYAAIAPFVFTDINPVSSDVVLAGLYVSDYAMAFWQEPFYLSHTWSLAVEEHFYLVWPLLIVATRSFSVRSLSWLLLAGFVTATTWRLADAHLWQNWQRTYYRFDTRMSGLLLGALVAVMPWRLRHHAALVGRVSIYVLLVALVCFRFRSIWFIGWGGIAVDLAAAGLVLSLVSGETAISKFLSREWLRYPGLLSYSIYLWHYPIALALRDNLNPFTASLVVALLATFIAALSYRYIEKPLKDLQDRKRTA